MDMEIQKLFIKVVRLDASGPPRRQLELTCNVKNQAPFDICILDAWITVATLDGLRLADGKLFHLHFPISSLAIIRSGQECPGVIIIELPSMVLNQIEAQRAGGDFGLRISSTVIACEVRSQNGTITLGAPLLTQFEDRPGGNFEYTVPQSEWIKVLLRLGWSEIGLLEIPSRNLKANPALARALKRLEDAQDCYRRGYWEDSMANCRKVFEALIKNVADEDDMSHALEAIESLIGKGQKAESINKMVKELSDFLQIARHEKLPAIQIKPEDAELALHFTGALLAYLGGK